MTQAVLETWQDLELQLRNFIRSKIKDESLSEDLMQEVFIKVHDNVEHLRNKEKVIPWMFSIARNEVNQHFRDLNKHHKPEIEEREGETFNYNSHFRSCLIRLLDALPEKYREAIELTELEDISQKELAERLGISYSGAKSRVQRGRDKLKQLIKDCCHIEHDAYGNVVNYKGAEKKNCDC